MPSSKWICENSAEQPLALVAIEGINTRIKDIGYFLPRAAFLWEEDIEHVHGLRVCTRRAAATLELFRSLLPSKKTRRLQKTLKRLRKCADSARDLDVYLGRLSEESDADASSLRRWLQTEREKAQIPIVDVAVPLLSGKPLVAVGQRLTCQIATSVDTSCPYGEWSALQLAKQWGEFVSEIPPPEPGPDQLHEFRIRGKRLRYSIEILSGGLPGVVREKIYPEITKLQDKLGSIQDHAVTAERLSEWQTKADDPAQKRLLAQLESNERAEFVKLSEAFRRWWRPQQVSKLKRLVDAVTSTAK